MFVPFGSAVLNGGSKFTKSFCTTILRVPPRFGGPAGAWAAGLAASAGLAWAAAVGCAAAAAGAAGAVVAAAAGAAGLAASVGFGASAGLAGAGFDGAHASSKGMLASEAAPTPSTLSSC